MEHIASQPVVSACTPYVHGRILYFDIIHRSALRRTRADRLHTDLLSALCTRFFYIIACILDHTVLRRRSRHRGNIFRDKASGNFIHALTFADIFKLPRKRGLRLKDIRICLRRAHLVLEQTLFQNIAVKRSPLLRRDSADLRNLIQELLFLRFGIGKLQYAVCTFLRHRNRFRHWLRIGLRRWCRLRIRCWCRLRCRLWCRFRRWLRCRFRCRFRVRRWCRFRCRLRRRFWCRLRIRRWCRFLLARFRVRCRLRRGKQHRFPHTHTQIPAAFCPCLFQDRLRPKTRCHILWLSRFRRWRSFCSLRRFTRSRLRTWRRFRLWLNRLLRLWLFRLCPARLFRLWLFRLRPARLFRLWLFRLCPARLFRLRLFRGYRFCRGCRFHWIYRRLRGCRFLRLFRLWLRARNPLKLPERTHIFISSIFDIIQGCRVRIRRKSAYHIIRFAADAGFHFGAVTAHSHRGIPENHTVISLTPRKCINAFRRQGRHVRRAKKRTSLRLSRQIIVIPFKRRETVCTPAGIRSLLHTSIEPPCRIGKFISQFSRLVMPHLRRLKDLAPHACPQILPGSAICLLIGNPGIAVGND